MRYKIHHADILAFQPEIKYHALLFDPPYHMGSIAKRYNKVGNGSVKDATVNRENGYARTAHGFMNTNWDSGDLFYQPETWAHLRDWLQPGGFMLAFTSPTSHAWMTVAMDLAGWDVHPTIYNYVSGQVYAVPMGHLGWIYASGMTKATNIATQIERGDCAKVCQCGYYGPVASSWTECPECGKPGTKRNGVKWRYPDDFEPMQEKPPFRNPVAQRFAGHRYGKQAMAPAFEPIILAQRPFDRGTRPVDQIVSNGAGCLNIDDCRIPFESDADFESATFGTQTDITSNGYNSKRPSDGFVHARNVKANPMGRWPANVILTCHCDPLRPDPSSHDPGCPVHLLNRQSGMLKGGSPTTGIEPTGQPYGKTKDVYGKFNENQAYAGYDDSGGASRYFFNSDWSYEIFEAIARTGPQAYFEKVKSVIEREAGIYTEELVRQRLNAGGLSEEPRWQKQNRRNPHPTLKSLKLTKYLATLLAPPKDYAPRRLGVPCAGVGSEMLGGLLAGWEYVEGIELTNTDEQPYVDIAQQRLAWWTPLIEAGLDVDRILDVWRNETTRESPDSDYQQASLF